MFENKREKLAHISVFTKRVLVSIIMATLLIVAALSIGLIGYHSLAKLDWIDSFLESAMILGGMGPVNPLITPEAKLFAACYALFSGLIFIAIVGVVLAPVAHRMLHKFHIDDEDLQ